MSIAIFVVGGLTIKKLYSMYKNVWNELDHIVESVAQINVRNELNHIIESVAQIKEETQNIKELAAKIEHLHRDTFFAGDPVHSDFTYNWTEDVPPYIAHACGGIENKTYTNSPEAFLLNYEQGHRIFEIDFNLSEDGVLIASHRESDWRRMTGTDLPYTSENFNQLPLYEKYESLSCSEIIDLMAEYPDAFLITDTKDGDQNKVMLAFSQLVYCAKQTHPEVLDRIIPQIYNEEMLSWISAIYPFKSVIFTLYATDWTPDSVLDFCMNSGIRFITMPVNDVSQEIIRLWDTMNIQVAVHTVNDEKRIEDLFKMGVDMIYTDFVIPE